MKSNIIRSKEYTAWLGEIKSKIRSAQIKAAVRVNTELLSLYWDLGKTIVEKQAKSKWGDGIIEQLSRDLLSEFPEMQGFSRTNLMYIKKWFLFYTQPFNKVPQLVAQLPSFPKVQQLVGQLGTSSKVQQLVGQLRKSQQTVDQIQEIARVQQLVSLIPWGHNIQIITKCKDIKEALFYVKETISNNWSRSVLVHQIESKLYQRKGKAITNFELTLPKQQSDLAREILKNPYNFDFLSLGKEVQERDLEKALLANLKKFLLELGKGFAYVGNQFNIVVEEDDYFLDLLFYNYHLHCFVVFELKVKDFKPDYVGKLNFYINTVDAQIKNKDHKPTIGILLCKTPNKTVIEYSLRGFGKPMGVTDYQLSKVLPEKLKNDLPTVEELERELEREVWGVQNDMDNRTKRMNNKLRK